MAYKIGGKEFSNKSEITSQCQKIRDGTLDRQVVDDLYPEFLFDLCKYHNEWHMKAEGGVSYISTQTTEHGTRCFVLIKKMEVKLILASLMRLNVFLQAVLQN